MMSSRFAPIVCALLGLALVPTYIHSYTDSTVHDGRRTSAIATALAGYTAVPSARNASWGKRRFDSDDWTERLYSSRAGEARLTVVRSYDPKSLYHHPELAVAYRTNYDRTELQYLPGRPDVPVHVLRGEGGVAMYVLHYGDRFIADPMMFQIRTAGELLFSGRKPMTLFFVTDTAASSSAPIETLPSAKLLLAAADQFVALGSPAPAGR